MNTMTTTPKSARMDAVTDTTYFEAIPAEDCWELLRTHGMGRIAWANSEGITILPVNHTVVEGGIIVRTTPTGLLGELAHDVTVAFQIDEVDAETRIAWSVLARGRAKELTEAERVDQAASIPEPWAGGERHLLLRINVEQISGRVLSGE